MDSESHTNFPESGEEVSSGELNSWRRGFTPQAEIWNGRMAMFGLAVGVFIILTYRIFIGN